MFLKNKEEYEKKFNEEFKKTGIFWAFSNEQFEEYKTHKNVPDNEYYSIGNGSYVHKSNIDKVNNFFEKVEPKLKKEFTSKIKMEDLIEYELGNHECYLTGNYEDVIKIVKDYYPNVSSKNILNKVKKIYNQNLEIEKSKEVEIDY